MLQVIEQDLLIEIPFISVFEYLGYFREISLALDSIGSKALVFCAAAVSDFYIPFEDMVGAAVINQLIITLTQFIITVISRLNTRFRVQNILAD